jgi:transposase
VVWDNVNTHSGPLIEAFVEEQAGQLVLLYLPTYSPWLNPIERVWRHFRRYVTHCELFESLHDLVEAAKTCFRNWNKMPDVIRSVLGHSV